MSFEMFDEIVRLSVGFVAIFALGRRKEEKLEVGNLNKGVESLRIFKN